MEKTHGSVGRFCTSASMRMMNASVYRLFSTCAHVVGAPCAVLVMYWMSKLPSTTKHVGYVFEFGHASMLSPP